MNFYPCLPAVTGRVIQVWFEGWGCKPSQRNLALLQTHCTNERGHAYLWTGGGGRGVFAQHVGIPQGMVAGSLAGRGESGTISTPGCPHALLLISPPAQAGRKGLFCPFPAALVLAVTHRWQGTGAGPPMVPPGSSHAQKAAATCRGPHTCP